MLSEESLGTSVVALRELLGTAPLPTGSDIDADGRRVDLLSCLEELKNAACAVQAQLAVDLDRSVRAQHAAAGLPSAAQGRGVAARIALARRESPHRALILLGLARDLVRDLPLTLAAVRGGGLSEYRAMLVARETACLEGPERHQVDTELFTRPEDGTEPVALGWGTGQLAGTARAIGYRLDPVSVVRRARRAESERSVSLRPAPDTMTYLTALLPLATGVAAYGALLRGAQGARAAGDSRSKGQLMADLLTERLTGTDTGAGVPASPPVAVTVDLVMSENTLFGGGHDPALLLGPGVGGTPLPAQTARELVAQALEADPDTLAWIRRLYTDPGGELVAMSSTQRFARGALAEFLRIRDHGICRTPWCDAPISDYDHVRPAEHGGPTTAGNLQGLCAACNHSKQAPGWQQDVHTSGTPHEVETRTPSGKHYHSRTPTTRPATHHLMVEVEEPRRSGAFIQVNATMEEESWTQIAMSASLPGPESTTRTPLCAAFW